jgi:hypothetical protein
MTAMKRYTIKILPILFISMTLGQQDFEKVGTSGSHFLDISPDARVAGMANSVVGTKITDASAVFYNPAALVYMKGSNIFFSRVNWFAGINYNSLSGGMKTPIGNLAVHIRQLSTGDINETTVQEQQGTGRSFVWNDLALGISWARSLTDRFSFGANFSLIKESVNLYNYEAGAWAVDIGTLYITGFNSLKLGMSVRNFGPELDFEQDGKDATFDDYHNGELLAEPESYRPYHMPLMFQVGISYDFLEDLQNHKLMFALDAVHPNDSAERLNLGMQYGFMNILFLRGGFYSNHNSASFMGGVGFDLGGITPIANDLRFDMAVSNYGLLGFVKQFTLAIGL